MEHCENFNHFGASISNGFDNLSMMNQARKQIIDHTEWVWLGGYFDGKRVIWKDGVNSTYRNFAAADQPAGHIVANLKDGSWDTVRHGNYPVACVGLKTPTRCTSTEFIGEPVPPCDPEWLYAPSTKGCYKLIGDFAGFQWAAARDRCLAMDADLASIHSDEENRIVASVAQQYSPVSLQTPYYNYGGTWIGAKTADPKTNDFQWSDGTKFGYTNWTPGRPSTNVEPHLYVLMVTARFNYTKEPFINYSLYLNRWTNVRETDCYTAVCKKRARY
ncbi:unnamed protein product, partial [Mesorhabditis spiculigera]